MTIVFLRNVEHDCLKIFNAIALIGCRTMKQLLCFQFRSAPIQGWADDTPDLCSVISSISYSTISGFCIRSNYYCHTVIRSINRSN
jgi:hypothetical protein